MAHMDEKHWTTLSYLEPWAIKRIVPCITQLRGLPANQQDTIASLCCMRYERSKQLETIHEAVLASQAAVELTSQRDMCYAWRLERLGMRLCIRYEHAEDPVDLSKAINAFERSLEADKKAQPWEDVFGSLLQHFHLPLLQGPISDCKKLLEVHRVGLRTATLSGLALALQLQFDITFDADDVRRGTQLLLGAIAQVPSSTVTTPAWMVDVAHTFPAALKSWGFHPSIVTQAGAFFQTAVQALAPPSFETSLAAWYGSLGDSLHQCSLWTGSVEDMDQSSEAIRQAKDHATSTDPRKLAAVLERLAYTLLRRFRRTGKLEDVEQAIEAQQQVVRLAAPSDRNLSVCLANLAAAFLARYQHARDPSDIEEAISTLKRASISPGATVIQLHIDRNLANTYCARASHFGAIEDHDEAVRIYRSIHFRSQSSSRIDQFQALYSLGLSLYRRFQRRGPDAVADHEEAIAFLREGLDMASPRHPSLPDALGLCGVALHVRFQRSGSMVDIQDAILMLERAIEASPSPEFPNIIRGGLFHDLGMAYQTKFMRTRRPADINDAVSFIEKTLSHVPAGHPRRWLYLRSLGSVLHSRFNAREKGSGTEADVEQVVKALQESLECAPPADPDYSGLLGTLGNALASRYKLTGSPQDAQNSISSLTRAIDLLPEDHPDASIHLFNLARAFQVRFERSKLINDNAEAIKTYLKVIDGYPEEHALLPIIYEDLGHSLLTRFKETSLQEDFLEAVSVYRHSARSSVGSPSVRFHAACQWATLCDLYNPSECLEAYKVAIRLMSEVAGLQETVQRRHGYMEKSSNVSLRAAATAFSMGETVKALEWLEQGRCLVWNQIAMLRSPLDTLRAYDERLAERLSEVSKDLELAGNKQTLSSEPSASGNRIALHTEAKNHASLANEWHGIVKSIRSIAGLEDFLQPPSYEHLRLSLPASGYVVMVNVSDKRCDSVVLTHGSDEPLHIPLTNFSFEKASSLQLKLDRQLRSNILLSRKDSISGEEQGITGVVWGSDRAIRPLQRKDGTNAQGGVLCGVLAELWTSVTKPIFDKIGLKPCDAPNKPRMWWCVTGPLVFLPLHAAGVYGVDEQRVSSLDYAISSYIPTIGYFRNLGRRSNLESSLSRGLLIISQPEISGLPPIPGVQEEVDAISEVMRASRIPFHILEAASATVENTSQRMKALACVHIATHAFQNLDEPLGSGFHLHDRPLTLSNIMQSSLVLGDLAFLSACDTSRGDEKLSEEAVHLAGGLLAAGYRSVIATMWSINDGYAPTVARSFYEHLIQEGGESQHDTPGRILGLQSAFSIHHAIQELRNKLGDSETSLLKWVPYVHFGL